MRKRVLVDVGVILVLVAAYFAQDWARARWAEFTVMRQVVAAVACSNPAEAVKIGINCPAPPKDSGTPAPVAPGKPGDDKASSK